MEIRREIHDRTLRKPDEKTGGEGKRPDCYQSNRAYSMPIDCVSLASIARTREITPTKCGAAVLKSWRDEAEPSGIDWDD